MTQRRVDGDATRSKYRRAQNKITELGLTPEVVDILAEGVREFDEQRTAEQRTVSALEKIAGNTTPERDIQNSREWEERRLRRREVYAQELLAVSVFYDGMEEEDVAAIAASAPFKRLVERLKGDGDVTAP